MARELYNFIWTMPPLHLSEPARSVTMPLDKLAVDKLRFRVPLQSGATVNLPLASTRAVILFPALLTPLVHVDKSGNSLELLIATEGELTANMVNRQLKISPGLRSDKPYDPGPLLGGAGGKIEVSRLGPVTDKIVRTDTLFRGILHPTFVKALKDQNLTWLYKIKLDPRCLPTCKPKHELTYSRTEIKFASYETSVQDPSKVVKVVKKSIVGAELHDTMIREMLDRRFGTEEWSNPNPIAGRCRYAFALKGNTVDLVNADQKQPIQSYHPLVVYSGEDAFSYANLGHVSDIHMNSRWQMLGKTRARVIEWGEGEHLDESPEIGGILVETNRSFHSVLHRVLDSEAHAVIVGGDLIDHVRNAYSAARMLSSKNTVHQIWDAMNLDGEAYTETSYPHGLDLVAFYSLIVAAIAEHRKPMFGITGNHDCYVDAFGISPRLKDNRANAGIPSDLNLTLYEALLAFGPSAGMLRKVLSSFDSDWFEWFHLVLTPFNDWWFKLPSQSLVGLGWGNTEVIIDTSEAEQGFGHLPLAEEAITQPQLELLKLAVAERSKHNVTLTSHFTFLSYREEVPMSPGGKAGSKGTFEASFSSTPWFGDIVASKLTKLGVSGTNVRNKFEMGTFERNRVALLDMLAAREIQCVLTGHSHRRGLHLLGARKGTEISAYLYDTDPVCGLTLDPPVKRRPPSEPAIIVSDSGGPYPRYNLDGEFNGLGSDRPGGTLVKFHPSSGHITNVRTIQAVNRPQPRAAVALDYYDVVNDGVLLGNGMSVREVSPEEASGACGPLETPLWHIDLQLTHEIASIRKINVTRLIFAGRKTATSAWTRVEACWDARSKSFVVPMEQTAAFRSWLRVMVQPTRFVSMQLGSVDDFLQKHYNWDSFWNFEVTVKEDTHPAGSYKQARSQLDALYVAPRRPDLVPDTSMTKVSYHIFRPTREIEQILKNYTYREIPNYAWRARNDPKYAPG